MRCFLQLLFLNPTFLCLLHESPSFHQHFGAWSKEVPMLKKRDPIAETSHCSPIS